MATKSEEEFDRIKEEIQARGYVNFQVDWNDELKTYTCIAFESTESKMPFAQGRADNPVEAIQNLQKAILVAEKASGKR